LYCSSLRRYISFVLYIVILIIYQYVYSCCSCHFRNPASIQMSARKLQAIGTSDGYTPAMHLKTTRKSASCTAISSPKHKICRIDEMIWNSLRCVQGLNLYYDFMS
jgi:hypothetical protein